jgi:ATP synthase protein I
MEPSNSGLKRTLGQIGPYLNLGLEFAVTLLVFIFAGHYLDKRWGTEPWIFLAGAALGILVAFYIFFKTLSKLTDRDRPKGTGEK